MDLSQIVSGIKKTFVKRKKLDFEEEKLHFEFEPLTALEEIKVLEKAQEFDGALYIDAVKRFSLACAIKSINGEEMGEEVSYEENGEKKLKSKFLYLSEQMGGWPTTLLDILFAAYTNMVQEMESKILKEAKFEIFKLADEPEKNEPSSRFRRITETDVPEDEVGQLNKQVEKELEQANISMSDSIEKEKEKGKK